MNEPKTNLIWIDLEMTGLDTETDSILEIATLVTDSNLEMLAEGPELAIWHEPEVLEGMDEWNTRHHTESGLVERVKKSTISMDQAQQTTLEFLAQWTAPGSSPMCGNSICQDRRFLARLMPELCGWFHYRNLDVSSLKELCHRWAPHLAAGFTKHNRHRAISDIRESVEELRYYRRFMGELAGKTQD